MNRSSATRNRIVVTIFALAIVAGATWFVLNRTSDATAESGVAAGSGAQQLGENELAAIAAQRGSISITVEAPAVVEPVRQLSVRGGITGTVVETVPEGTIAATGDLLVRFDGAQFRRALGQAELNVQQAEIDRQRAQVNLDRAMRERDDAEALFQSGSVNRGARDAAREAVAIAELDRDLAEIRVNQNTLAVEAARADLAATEVRAPYNGVVLKTEVGTGDIASSGTVLLTFADVSRLRVLAEVDEFDVGILEPGMPVRITADALGTEEISSTLERVSPAAEVINNISIFTVSSVIRADQATLRPGMSADLTVLVSDDTGLIVPSNAVSSVRGRAYLDVYEKEEVVTKRVVAGTDDGRETVILDGLEEGALVIVPEVPGFTLATGGGDANAEGSSIIPIPMPGAGGGR
ncbi:MAG: efflux RND transporter periplasmic adaptor subunit [Alkalispirochaeta sp.]